MTRFQKFLLSLFPSRAADIQAESQSWILRCPCGFERSVWELGVIRYKAKGHSRKRMECPQCQQITWHSISRKEEW